MSVTCTSCTLMAQCTVGCPSIYGYTPESRPSLGSKHPQDCQITPHSTLSLLLLSSTAQLTITPVSLLGYVPIWTYCIHMSITAWCTPQIHRKSKTVDHSFFSSLHLSALLSIEILTFSLKEITHILSTSSKFMSH